MFIQGVAIPVSFVSQMAVASLETHSAMTVSHLSSISFPMLLTSYFPFPFPAFGACCPSGSVYSLVLY